MTVIEKSMIKGYRHTGIIVKNLDASLHFYRYLLELSVFTASDASSYLNGAIISMDGGRSVW